MSNSRVERVVTIDCLMSILGSVRVNINKNDKIYPI